ncbi:phage holin family protein [Prochlorococcus marinus]|uniref:phage holin family protein n=1 Tax=Prochlorococcus marinus TaxID=1219 RepID=UPI0022B5D973|nr:phage holin family protein [Prochlorococcus marinus]
MTDFQQRSKGFGAAARVTALASSIMDLHVRIALQEVDREKRRLISGGIFLAMGGILMLFSLLGIQIITIIWMQSSFNFSLPSALFILACIDLALAGISLRLGGHLTKGPYLPETLEGISKTTKAVLGKT